MAQLEKVNIMSDALLKKAVMIVGLANPGPDYVNTRHNAGDLMVQSYLHKLNLSYSQKPQLSAMVAETMVGDTKVIIATPTTFMNESGKAVFALQQYFELTDDQILVVTDDIDIPLGTLRSRLGGSSGGHNGLKSIINSIGEDFARLRVGVGPVPDRIDSADFVLGRFNKADQAVLDKLMPQAQSYIEQFIARTYDNDSYSLTT